MDAPLLVYTTFPDEATARSIARALVERKLAACVNLLPGMTSVYAWEGAIEEAGEIVGIVKTRKERAEAVSAAIRELHPYDTPAILFLPAGADGATWTWLQDGTGR